VRAFLRSRLARMSDANQARAYAGYYRLLAFWQRLRYAGVSAPAGGWPIVLNMSFPKSGTNLMSQVIGSFSKVGPFAYHAFARFAPFDPRTGEKRTERDAVVFLNTLRPRDLASAHMPVFPAVVQRVCTPDFVPYFLYRDPRDVVVSHAFYLSEMAADHHLHAYYAEHLGSFDERLSASIVGADVPDADFPNVALRFDPYADWLNHPEVLSVRFEQFVQDRVQTLVSIADHFLRRVNTLGISPERLAEVLAAGIDPEQSKTFRSGRVGEWRTYFSAEHKRVFKAVAGDLLLRLGYEQDNNW
jgi:hypothetical protein